MKDIENKACQVLRLNQCLELQRKFILDIGALQIMKKVKDGLYGPLLITSSIFSIFFLFRKKLIKSSILGIFTGFSFYIFQEFETLINKCNQKVKQQFAYQDPRILFYTKKFNDIQAFSLVQILRDYTLFGHKRQNQQLKLVQNSEKNSEDIKLNIQFFQNEDVLSYTKDKFINDVWPQFKKQIIDI